MLSNVITSLLILAVSVSQVAAQSTPQEVCAAVCARRTEAATTCQVAEGAFNACLCTAANLKLLDDCSNCLITENVDERQSSVARGTSLHSTFQTGCAGAGFALASAGDFVSDIDFWATSGMTRPGSAPGAAGSSTATAGPATAVTPPAAGAATSSSTPAAASTPPAGISRGPSFQSPADAASPNSNSTKEDVVVPANDNGASSVQGLVSLAAAGVLGVVAALL